MSAKTTLVQSPVSLGRALRDARRKRGLTQQQLANLAGVAQPTVSVVERGQNRTSLDTILRLLAALDLEIVLQSRQAGTAPWQQGS
jgi:HTH-type transcriptional regulator/antitoxin HipB